MISTSGVTVMAASSRFAASVSRRTGMTTVTKGGIGTFSPSHLRTVNPMFAGWAYNCPMLIRKAPDLRYSDVTPKSVYLRRREFIQAAAGAAAGAAAALSPFGRARAQAQAQGRAKLPNVKKSALSTTEKVNPYEDITRYNKIGRESC